MENYGEFYIIHVDKYCFSKSYVYSAYFCLSQCILIFRERSEYLLICII